MNPNLNNVQIYKVIGVVLELEEIYKA